MDESDLIQLSLVTRFNTYLVHREFIIIIFFVWVDLRWTCETQTYFSLFNDVKKLVNRTNFACCFVWV